MMHLYSMRRAQGDHGVTLILVALAMVAMLIVAAFVIDIGFLRGGTRFDQKTADLAALAGGKDLGAGNYGSACEDIVRYLNANAPDMPTAIDPASFCHQSGNDVDQTTCSGGTGQALPKTTVGRYTIALHFPVLDGESSDPPFGVGKNDGTACERMEISVTATEPSFFGGVVGKNSYSATRSATVRGSIEESKRTPALWLLAPTGCTSLGVSGNSQVTVGSGVVPGLIAIDSDGQGCGGQTTISSVGSQTFVKALSTPSDPGEISLFALPTGSTTCVGSSACNQSDVDNSRLQPQPQASGERATRAPVDWKFNCKTGYPNYLNIVPIADCPAAAATPPYIDGLRAAMGNTNAPPGYQHLNGKSCTPSADVALTGNWWVDCPKGFTIGSGVKVTFANGDVIFDGGVSMTGTTSQLNINTGNTGSGLSSACLPPSVTVPCVDRASPAAGIVYVRNGNLDLNGGTLSINHSVVYVDAPGYVKVAGAAPQWTAPTEGPFAGLALWAESTSTKFNINGGAGVALTGTFFTPGAALSLTGGGDWGQQSAQFISYQLAVSGGGILAMAPDPYVSVNLPPKAGILIR
jgi:hypothetical protein